LLVVRQAGGGRGPFGACEVADDEVADEVAKLGDVAPEEQSQTPSSPAAASVRPSGVNARTEIGPVRPVSGWPNSVRVWRSHSQTGVASPSAPDVASKLPSRLKATASLPEQRNSTQC
jgi:hypothetical protein